jgi:protein translocase SecG subunit
MSILLNLLTAVLILVSLFLVLVVLAQKSKDGGMGAALGGGAAEAAFGAETGNVLSKSTIYGAIIFRPGVRPLLGADLRAEASDRGRRHRAAHHRRSGRRSGPGGSGQSECSGSGRAL